MGSAFSVASVGSLLSSDDHFKEIVPLISEEAKIDAAVQRKCYDLDDDLEISTGEPLPICVFGGAPTLQQAKDATSEMKDALVRIKGKGPTEIKPNVTRNIMLMVNELKDPKFKSAVVSIANDPNAWEAVLKNPAIQEYINTMRCHKKSTTPSLKMISHVTEIVGGLDFIYDEPLNNSSLFEKLSDVVKDLSQNVKTRVVGMVSSLSQRIYNRFGTYSAASVESSFMNDYASAAMCALLVIVLLVLKR